MQEKCSVCGHTFSVEELELDKDCPAGCNPTPVLKYGNEGTIHQSTGVDVELDKDGKVLAVWFRCCPLAFTQSTADASRAAELKTISGQKITAVDIVGA